MSIPPESIEIGKCYLAKGTSVPRVRRVIEILPDGRVHYEQRTPKTDWQLRIQYRDVFASIIEREVPCDWTPE